MPMYFGFFSSCLFYVFSFAQKYVVRTKRRIFSNFLKLAAALAFFFLFCVFLLWIVPLEVKMRLVTGTSFFFLRVFAVFFFMCAKPLFRSQNLRLLCFCYSLHFSNFLLLSSGFTRKRELHALRDTFFFFAHWCRFSVCVVLLFCLCSCTFFFFFLVTNFVEGASDVYSQCFFFINLCFSSFSKQWKSLCMPNKIIGNDKTPQHFHSADFFFCPLSLLFFDLCICSSGGCLFFSLSLASSLSRRGDNELPLKRFCFALHVPYLCYRASTAVLSREDSLPLRHS